MIDWFFRWLDQITQSVIWSSIFAHFQWVDWLASFFLLGGMLYGVRKGFLGALATLLELFIINYLVLEYYGHLNLFLLNYVKKLPETVSDPASFIVTAIIVWVVVSMIARYLSKLVHADVAKPLRVFGGMVVGGFYFIFLLSFISQAIIRLPLDRVRKVYGEGGSYSGFYLSQLAPEIQQIIQNPMRAYSKEVKNV